MLTAVAAQITETKNEWLKQAYPDQPVLWLKLLCILHRIINQTKASGFPPSKMGAELEYKDGILILHFIHSSQFLL